MTGEMHFPLLVFTLSSLAEAALRSGSRSPSLRAASARDESGNANGMPSSLNYSVKTTLHS